MSSRNRKQYTPRWKPGERSEYTFEKEKNQLSEWIDQRLSLGDVPRLSDVKEYARVSKIHIPIKVLSKMFRLHRAYVLSSRQQRDPKRSRKQPVIFTNSLGCLHGDIGYFSISSEFVTPKTFQSGYMIFKDVLSKYVYVDLIKGKKSAENLVRVMKRIQLHHRKVHPDYEIKSIAFDKERGMDSHLIKQFMKNENIKLVFFENTASKAKLAEGTIRLIRHNIKVLRQSNSKNLWWQIIQKAVDQLNSKTIMLEKKDTGYRPIDINTSNVKDYIKKIQKILPSLYFSQFGVDPRFIDFKFKLGDQVRTKLLLSSSQVIGNKRSEISLDPKTLFEITEFVPLQTRDLHLKPGYRCREVSYGYPEIFAEEDIALVKPAGQE